MYCTKKITSDITWIGANDRRLAMFEGVYSVPTGVSYNSYLINDDTTVLLDTVDKSVSGIFFENLEHALAGRELDYVIIQHMEPDHSATLAEVMRRYPNATLVCNDKILKMVAQFFAAPDSSRVYIVKEGDKLETGNHTLNFVMAPMVHWPEVMVTFDSVDGILFSADAFGTFGALNGAIFADEVDFMRDYLDEARRYYCNIVGKYGTQVQALLKKASALDIKMICPLHGFVWREKLGDYIDKYVKWSSYTPEEQGVMIAYASVYGNTATTAEIISSKLRERGIKTVMYDVSVTHSSEIVAAAFKYSHLLFASTTYNAGIFISMDELLRDIASHGLKKRFVSLVENGSWAPTSGGQMKEILSTCKDMTFIGDILSVKSALKPEQATDIDALVDAIADTFPKAKTEIAACTSESELDPAAFFKLSYGLFVLSAKDGSKDNACIINTAQLLTDTPKRITVSVNKANLTHDMILKTGVFNVSVLTESVPFDVFKDFGFVSGRNVDKFDGRSDIARSANGLCYLTSHVNALISGKVTDTVDKGTHTLFIADVTDARVLSNEKSVTYDYYFEHIKPKPQPVEENKKGFVCKICGYVYEGDTLPADYICPLCKHGAEDFEPLA
ncbi:MAG: MBL fold metallo-hydrolase [Clostridiales bacterium]|nr:MBL fold metallo-hydrolase [Clostridiales bacterium]